MSTLLDAIRAKGLRGTWRAIADRLEEAALEPYWERRLGIATSGTVPREALGYAEPEYSHYAPTAYGNILRMLRALDIRTERREVLIDLGSGKGRVLVMAARHPFARIVGVERSPELAAAARRNVERTRRNATCQHVEIVTADAASYDVQDAATIVYFASPFSGHVLDAVLDKVRASLERAPRRLRLVSHGYDAGNPFERQIRQREWLALSAQVPLLRSNCAWIYENSRWSPSRAGTAR
jgi:SAM-dependent methyltransferase